MEKKNNRVLVNLNHKSPDMDKLPGGWKFDEKFSLDETEFKLKIHRDDSSLIYSIDNFISEYDCKRLIQLMKSSGKESPVTIQGRQDFIDDRIGSRRATCWSETISKEIHRKLDVFLPDRTMKDYTATDWWQGQEKMYNWNPVGISPLLRFMRYEKGGSHYSHYDAGYIREEEYRTLMSYVIYLTTNNEGGAIRFVDDGQENIPVWERDHNDWMRETREDEVYLKISPKAGKIILFDHRLCHDVEEYIGDSPRIVIRGDVIYKNIKQ